MANFYSHKYKKIRNKLVTMAHVSVIINIIAVVTTRKILKEMLFKINAFFHTLPLIHV